MGGKSMAAPAAGGRGYARYGRSVLTLRMTQGTQASPRLSRDLGVRLAHVLLAVAPTVGTVLDRCADALLRPARCRSLYGWPAPNSASIPAAP